MRVRCATINLRGIGERWFEERFQATLVGLKKHNLDLVCFQECTVHHEGEKIYDQAAEIGAGIGLPYSAFAPYGNPVEVMSRDQGGIGFASRWPIACIRNRRLCPGHDHIHDVRVAIVAKLLAEKPLEIATTHLSWRPDEAEVRLMQMGMLLHELSSDTPLLLLGDLNAVETEPAVEILKDRELKDAFRMLHPTEAGFTWNNENPLTAFYKLENRRIDYIFCGESANVHSCEVILDKPSPVYASDHFGVMADIEWSA